MTRQQYGDAVQAFMEGIRKAKALVKLNLERDVEGKKSFSKYANSKGKMRENTGPLLKGERDLVMKGMEQNASLGSVFTGKSCLQESQLSETPVGRSREKRIYSR